MYRMARNLVSASSFICHSVKHLSFTLTRHSPVCSKESSLNNMEVLPLTICVFVVSTLCELMSTSRHCPSFDVSTGLMIFCPSLVFIASLTTLDIIHFLQYKMGANDS